MNIYKVSLKNVVNLYKHKLKKNIKIGTCQTAIHAHPVESIAPIKEGTWTGQRSSRHFRSSPEDQGKQQNPGVFATTPDDRTAKDCGSNWI